MTHDEIMGLHKKTTQGEWTVEDPMGPDIISIVADGHRAVYEWKHIAQLSTADAEEVEDGEDIPMAEQRANAAFIAAAHKAVPEMAATIDRLTRERDEARREAFEEAAKVADSMTGEIKRLHATDYSHVKIGSLTAVSSAIADAIRALSPSKDEEQGCGGRA